MIYKPGTRVQHYVDLDEGIITAYVPAQGNQAAYYVVDWERGGPGCEHLVDEVARIPAAKSGN